jgi:hypothetical protein
MENEILKDDILNKDLLYSILTDIFSNNNKLKSNSSKILIVYITLWLKPIIIEVLKNINISDDQIELIYKERIMEALREFINEHIDIKYLNDYQNKNILNELLAILLDKCNKYFIGL